MTRVIVALLLLLFSVGCNAQPHPGADAFVQRAIDEFGMESAEVLDLLGEAAFQQSIVDAMRRPAEGKPWHEYRPIFLTEKRIDGGVAFWEENRELVEQASLKFGVDPQVIVAIIGVETLYGRITGSYRVLDALATLGFYYPVDTGRDRSAFFAGELLQFFVLSEEEGLPVRDVTGSYAGAMGMGQFIPSSYRAYAVDFDGDGSRDLWRSTADAIGSVANYLHRHGWSEGEPVTVKAFAKNDADISLASVKVVKPKTAVADYAEAGFLGPNTMNGERPAALLSLAEAERDTYWLTFDNFYVITRYNRSPLYAMAVFQLSEEIRQRVQAQ